MCREYQFNYTFVNIKSVKFSHFIITKNLYRLMHNAAKVPNSITNTVKFNAVTNRPTHTLDGDLPLVCDYAEPRIDELKYDIQNHFIRHLAHFALSFW